MDKQHENYMQCDLNYTYFQLVHVNHAGFDDVKKNLLDHDCHHQKGGECESCRF